MQQSNLSMNGTGGESELAAGARWKSFMAAGRMAYRAGDYNQAGRHFSRAITLCSERGWSGPAEATGLIELSICLSARRDYEEAERLLRRALSVSQADGEPALMALNYHELAVLYWRTGRAEASKQMSDLALQFVRTTQDCPGELEVRILNHQAVLLADQQKYGPALAKLEESLEIVLSDSDMGKNSPFFGQVLITKALILMDQGRQREARELFSETSPLIEMYWGPHHPKVSDLNEIFAVHAQAAGAEETYQECRRVSESVRDWLRRNHY